MSQKLVKQLLDNNIIKFGDFVLKSGEKSNLYFDLRTLISFPIILNNVMNLMYKKIKNLNYDIICGIAYTGIPMATKLSLDYNIPMVIIRKERKDYGTKKLIEGLYKEGQRCLMLDDVITTGSSLIENISILEKEKLIIKDIIVFIDRRLRSDIKDYNVYSVFKSDEIMEIIGGINKEVVEKNNMSEKLYSIMNLKKTNLALSADLCDKDEILNLISVTGPYICMVKIHMDIIKDFDEKFVYLLKKMADVYNFMIMEDRKFADIGNTTYLQYINNIIGWADFITMHSVMGDGGIKAVRKAIGSNNYERGIFLLDSVSSENNLIDLSYMVKTEEMAENNRDIVSGLITQKRLTTDMICATPGVSITDNKDNMGQKYNSPEYVINNRGTDIIIVGRGIYCAENRVEAVKYYRDRGWDVYKKKLKNVEP